MDIPEFVRWSAWPSVICYSIATGLRIGPRPKDWQAIANRIWLSGWVLLAIHIVIAMGVAHQWSLSAAYEHTARQTAAATGWKWGGGVYLNFATLGIWGWTIFMPTWTKLNNFTKNCVEPLSQLYLAFMVFNATVVFGSRPAQVVGILTSILLFWRYSIPESPR